MCKYGLKSCNRSHFILLRCMGTRYCQTMLAESSSWFPGGYQGLLSVPNLFTGLKELNPGPKGTEDPSPGIEERQSKGFFWLIIWPRLGQHTAATKGKTTQTTVGGVVGLQVPV